VCFSCCLLLTWFLARSFLQETHGVISQKTSFFELCGICGEQNCTGQISPSTSPSVNAHSTDCPTAPRPHGPMLIINQGWYNRPGNG
jgi:hypothetical protein